MQEDTHQGTDRVLKVSIFVACITIVFISFLYFIGTFSQNEIVDKEDGYVAETNTLETEVEKGEFASVADNTYELIFENDKVARVGLSEYGQPYLALNVENDSPELMVRMPFEISDEPMRDGSKIIYTSDTPETNEVYGDRVDIVIYPKESHEESGLALEFAGGLVEFDTVLYAKPKTNTLSFPIEANGLDFHYQPSLVEEDGRDGEECTETQCIDQNGRITRERPENIVGSYAVYYSEEFSSLSGEQPASGKAFHIFRPKVYDAVGNEVWGVMAYEEGVLSITVPQDFLDSATYPVTVDPTFGSDPLLPGSSFYWPFPDEMMGVRYTTPSDISEITSLTVYGRRAFSGDQFKAVILDSACNIVGVGSAVDAPSAYGWVTSTFATPVAVSPDTNYSIAVVSEGEPYIRYDSSGSVYEIYDGTNDFVSPETPPCSDGGSYKYSTYATYNAAGIGSVDDFVITVQTDNTGSSSDTQFEIPTSDLGETYNYNVDCDNDGLDDATGETGDYICDYATPGQYTIRIKDNTGTGNGFPRILFYDAADPEKLTGINQWGTGHWVSMESAFDGASNLNNAGGAATDAPNLSGVTDMGWMFAGASSFNQDIGGWDTSNVTTMRGMFWDAAAFNQNINGWTTSNVTSMLGMFTGATDFNQPLNLWDVSNVTNMNFMFQSTDAFDQPLSDWTTSSVTSMRGMFNFATAFNQNIDSWDVSNVTDMYAVFASAFSFNSPLENWDTSSAISMRWMFKNTPFNQPIPLWETFNVTDMNEMFSGATSFNQNINLWDVSSVTDMYGMFTSATDFNQPLNLWDVSSVTDMAIMFYNASSFNQDISDWTTSSVTDMRTMFSQATSFNQDLNGWDTSNVTIMDYMFFLSTGYNQDLGVLDVSNVTSMLLMLDGAPLSIENYDATLTGWEAQNLESGVSLGASGLNYCNAEVERTNMIASDGWTITGDSKYCASPDDFVITVQTDNPGATLDTQFRIQFGAGTNYNVDCNDDGIDEVTGRTSATYTCDYATPGQYTIRIKDNVGDGTGFTHMYFNTGDDEEKIVGVNQWGSAKWTSMQNMFYGASNLNGVGGAASDVPDLSSVTDMSYMFYGASSFNQDIGGWDTSNITTMREMFYNASSFNQDIGNWNTANVQDMAHMFRNATSFNQNIGVGSNWDVTNVIDMRSMFNNATSFNQNIGNWNTSNVLDMSYMFYGATSFDQNIGSWTTLNVQDMTAMFFNTIFNQNIGTWQTGSVTAMGGMFYTNTFFNQDIGGWDTSSVTGMDWMFYGANSFDQYLGSWNVSGVTAMDNMLDDTGLSITNYDNTLTAWNAQSLQSAVTLGALNLRYCTSESDRANMIASDGWSIVGDTKECLINAPVNIETEYQTNPSGITATNPMLGAEYDNSNPPPTSATHYDKLTDPHGAADGNATRVYTSSGTYQQDQYSLENPAASYEDAGEPISSVTYYMTSISGCRILDITVNGVSDTVFNQTCSSGGGTVSTTNGQQPNSSPWDWDAVLDLVFTLELKNAFGSYDGAVTQIYVRVDYGGSTPGSLYLYPDSDIVKGIDSAFPVTGGPGVETATAYQVQVREDGGNWAPPLWDSGQVATAVDEGDRQEVAYGGTALVSDGSTYYQRWRFWDSANAESFWSNGSDFWVMDGAPIGNPPTITLSATPSEVVSGNFSTLLWSTVDADSCVATAPASWAATNPKATTTDSESTGSLTGSAGTTFTFTLECTNVGGTSASSTVVTIINTECNDGENNDGEDGIDNLDPACLDTSGVWHPEYNDESNNPQCSDGIDNDTDGLTDFGGDPMMNDPGCSSLYDDSENNCGNNICDGGETFGTCPSDCAFNFIFE